MVPRDRATSTSEYSDTVHRRSSSPGRLAGAAGFNDGSSSDDPVVDSGLQKLEDDRGDVLGNPHGLTWVQTAALLSTEYISLAILSFPWSYSYLGLVGGILVTLVAQAIVVYTSIILWKFCLQNPGVKHICDIGQILFGGNAIFYELTTVGLVLNNLFIMALHCLTGSIMLNTLSGHTLCTVGFAGLIGLACAICTLPRQFSQLSWLGWMSAIFMFISVLLAMIFAGIQGTPNGYTATGGSVRVLAGASTPDFISQFNAMLNITYTLIGQITLPSFIADMKNPRDFPKALYLVSIVELVLMIFAGTVMYCYFGQYTVAPAIGALKEPFAKIAYGMAFPAVIVIGVLYASVLAQFLYLRFTRGTRDAPDAPARGNTARGWAIWVSIVFGTWAIGFVIAEVIPFFSDLLSVLSSAFDSWFGFIFWGVAFFHINPEARFWIATFVPVSLGGEYLRLSAKRSIALGTTPNLGRGGPADAEKEQGGVQSRAPRDDKDDVTVYADAPAPPISWRTKLESLFNVLIIGLGIMILVVGIWCSVASIIRSYRAGTVGRPFTCANNGVV